MCISHIVFFWFHVGLNVNWLVAGGQLSFRLGCICMNCINRSFHGAGLDPGCPINSIHHAEISGKTHHDYYKSKHAFLSRVGFYKSHYAL